MTKSVNSLLLTRIETWHATEQKPLPEGFFPQLAQGSTEGTESGPVLESNLHFGPSSGLPPTETFALNGTKTDWDRKNPQLALVQTEKRKNGMLWITNQNVRWNGTGTDSGRLISAIDAVPNGRTEERNALERFEHREFTKE
jgi:hypothetical protein